ncbi:PIG-L deacetylase family protein [Streptosporangium roseum]|uniref:LmbE family protein n=1 Tax=Streptosporangium roseum (strain ATCC 12428 / DSM 43021 / JCM 3005 / KCTC 9067 / NCIMB 10171 / NRRL 2505 / NI 9100) TaxID=479432 RepID=D2BFC8_STRRD|nr:PIG-L deacetylase family protein [Streptosporangium roseum]ACZ88286.1 LmbE family protein [Streptosporangium roseum DSM 43021]
MSKVLVVGAHPDEAEMYAGGTAALLARAGHAVKFVSLTNGDAGHFTMEPVPLARHRAKEAVRAAEALGVLEYEILDVHDGELEPSVAMRRKMIELIRGWRADVVIALHGEGPGHPDNRAAGRLVSDAVAFCTTPNVVPGSPALERQPLCLLMVDYAAPGFHRHDVAVDVDPVIDRKLDACAAHASQFFEYSPAARGLADLVPAEDATEERRAFVLTHWEEFMLAGDGMRPALAGRYGDAHARRVRHAETFQLADYGRAVPEEELRLLLDVFDGDLAARVS